MNGQTPFTPTTLHGKIEHCGTSVSGIGDIAQLNCSQRAPENPLLHGQAQVFVLKTNPFSHANGTHDVTTEVVCGTDAVKAPLVAAPQRHLNGQLPLTTAEPSHGISGHTWTLSGTGEVAQSNCSQKTPENPKPHWQEQVAVLKTNPFSHANGEHDVTTVVVTPVEVVSVVVGISEITFSLWNKNRNC